MDFALPLELLLVLVLLGERVLHLLEAHVVHAGGIDVGADKPGIGRAGETNGYLDGGVGVVRIIKGDVDLFVHRQLPSYSGVMP